VARKFVPCRAVVLAEATLRVQLPVPCFSAQNWPAACSILAMQPITFLGLLEEMIDIKIQQHTESRLKTTPEIAAVLHQKRETDKRRLDQIRAELLRLMSAQ
jgi:hypothetical protein